MDKPLPLSVNGNRGVRGVRDKLEHGAWGAQGSVAESGRRREYKGNAGRATKHWIADSRRGRTGGPKRRGITPGKHVPLS